MTIAVEAGSNATPVQGSNVCNTSISTVNPSDIILCAFTAKGANKKINSIVDTAGLNWQRYKLYNTLDPSVDVWYANAPAAMNGLNLDSITVTLSAYTAVGNVDIIGISGANYSSPFDPNAASSGTANGTASIPTVTSITTSNANDMVIGICGVNTNLTETAGSGYTLIDTDIATGTVSGSTVYNAEASQEQIFSSTQSGISVAFGTTSGATIGWSMIVLAIQQGAAAPTGVPSMFVSTPDPGAYTRELQNKFASLIDSTNEMTKPHTPGIINTGFEYLRGAVYSSAPAALFKNYLDSTTMPVLIDYTDGMATPIVPGLISTGFEYLRGNVYSTRSEAIDYAVLIYPVGFPTILTVPPILIQSGPATGVMVLSAYNHLQYNEVLGYLQEFQKDLPRSLIIQPPLAQPLAIGPYFPGIAGTYGMSASELAYLAELRKTFPTNLNVQAPLISVIPPPPPPNTQILNGAQYGMRPEILASLTLVPVDYPYTLQPPFVIAQAGVSAILTPGFYGSDHAEIQGYLQDYQLKFPRNLTINPTTTLLPGAVTQGLVTFQFGTKAEILEYLELLKQQQPRVQHTQPFVSLTPVVGNLPILIGGTKVGKGSANCYVVKGNATTSVIIV